MLKHTTLGRSVDGDDGHKLLFYGFQLADPLINSADQMLQYGRQHAIYCLKPNSMKKPIDLRDLLDNWPYDPENEVRLVRGTGGREIMQVRQPLGIEQYELEGRPDGQRPHDMESALAFHLARFEKLRAAGQEASFNLSHEDCLELFNEGVLYYYRYFHLFQLEDWPRTLCDTERNLRLFDFVNRYAELEQDRMYLEQWRPYITRMHAMTRAMIKLENQHHDQAMEIVREATEEIESLTEIDDPTFKFELKRSLVTLEELANQIEKNRPLSQLEQLQQELQKAVEVEDFERAAKLRDHIYGLRTQSRP